MAQVPVPYPHLPSGMGPGPAYNAKGAGGGGGTVQIFDAFLNAPGETVHKWMTLIEWCGQFKDTDAMRASRIRIELNPKTIPLYHDYVVNYHYQPEGFVVEGYIQLVMMYTFDSYHVTLLDDHGMKNTVVVYNNWKVLRKPDPPRKDPHYPHVCPRCKGAAYVGFNMVDCKKKECK